MKEKNIKPLFEEGQIVYIAKEFYAIQQYTFVGKINNRDVAILRDQNGGLIQYQFGWIFSSAFIARTYSLGAKSKFYVVPEYMIGTEHTQQHEIKQFRVTDTTIKGSFVRKLYVMNEDNIEFDAEDVFVSEFEAKMQSMRYNKIIENGARMKHYTLKIERTGRRQNLNAVCYYFPILHMDFHNVLN